jgi:hypothetical protein
LGSFYTSHTVRGPSQAQLLEWLRGRPAYVSECERGQVVVLDAACEEQDLEVLANFASRLSKEFCSPVLAVMNHDDDILYFELYEDGKKIDAYDSSPGYFDVDSESDAPTGGDAALLCRTFGATDHEQVEASLRGEYDFAVERHRDLAVALGLPLCAVGLGYEYVSKGESSPDAPDSEYTHTET